MVLLDQEGSEMEPAQVAARALMTARELIGHDARSGRIDLSYALEVRDEAGKTVHALYFTEAVEITGVV